MLSVIFMDSREDIRSRKAVSEEMRLWVKKNADNIEVIPVCITSACGFRSDSLFILPANVPAMRTDTHYSLSQLSQTKSVLLL